MHEAPQHLGNQEKVGGGYLPQSWCWGCSQQKQKVKKQQQQQLKKKTSLQRGKGGNTPGRTDVMLAMGAFAKVRGGSCPQKAWGPGSYKKTLSLSQILMPRGAGSELWWLACKQSY